MKPSDEIFKDMAAYKVKTLPVKLLIGKRSLALLKVFEEVYSYGFKDTP